MECRAWGPLSLQLPAVVPVELLHRRITWAALCSCYPCELVAGTPVSPLPSVAPSSSPMMQPWVSATAGRERHASPAFRLASFRQPGSLISRSGARLSGTALCASLLRMRLTCIDLSDVCGQSAWLSLCS